MEFPNLGQHCTETTCKKLDFLPIKCESCGNIFCTDHYHYNKHNCPNAYKKNIQVPVCPLCDKPVPTSRNQPPDVAVGAHIDNDCQADPAKGRRQVFTNKCTAKGCKNKEVVPVICSECTYNFCLKHRHPTDHSCQGKLGVQRKRAADAAANRTNGVSNSFSNVQGNMSEDEALAKALALSMQETSSSGQTKQTQEELDLALARQIQEAESVAAGSGNRNRSNRDRCQIT